MKPLKQKTIFSHKKGGTDGRPHPGILQKQPFAKRDSMKR